MTEEQATTIIDLVTHIDNRISSIDINIQTVGMLVFVAIIFYGCVKLLWAFLEPITLD